MPSITTLSTVAAVALGSLACARPIPHTVSLFRRATLDANEGFLVIQHKDAPTDYSDNLEPYDHYHFRYMAIGCSDVSKDTQFFDTCCQPRQVGKQLDTKYPPACQLASYLVFDPDYEKDKVVAKLGSLRDYQKKIGYSDEDVEDETSSSLSKSQEKPTSSSQPAPYSSSSSSSSSPKASDKSSSSSSAWSSSSAKEEKAWTPEAAPSSSSSSQWTPEASSSQWTPEASSSQWTPPAAPSPSSSSAQAWSQPAPSSSSQAAAPAPSSSANTDNNNNGNGGGSSENFTGQASWFTQNGNPGACGIYHSDADYIVALQQDMYGNLGQQSQYCGRSLTITNTATGATAQAVVADACPGCATYHSLDLSTGLFQALGSLDTGILPISWHFN